MSTTEQMELIQSVDVSRGGDSGFLLPFSELSLRAKQDFVQSESAFTGLAESACS